MAKSNEDKSPRWAVGRLRFYIVGLILVATGVILILLCHLLGRTGTLCAILESLGVSLIPAGTVALAYEYYLRKGFLEIAKEVIKEALAKVPILAEVADIKHIVSIGQALGALGLEHVYPDRRNINFIDMLNRSEPGSEIRVLGIALWDITDMPMQEALEERLKGHCRIRLLSLDPDSSFVEQRAYVEKRDIDDIRNDIRFAKKKHETFIANLPKDLRANIELRHYEASPVCYIFASGKTIVVGLYLADQKRQYFPHLELEVKEGGIHEPFVRHFDSLWEDAKIVQVKIIDKKPTEREAKTMAKKSISKKRGRSAVTGRFIPIEEATRKKRTSVVETVKKSKKK